ncbi:MAG: GAF domain-containing sensor histidine kinase [Candidatus Eremiobacterota bacterium]
MTPPRVTEGTLRDLTALASVVSATVRNFQPQEVMQTAMDRLLEVLGMNVGTIQLLEGEDHLALAVAVNVSPETRQELARMPVSLDRISTLCFRENRNILLDTVAEHPYADSSAAISREGLQSLAAVPIPGPHGPVGVLVIGSTGTVRVSEEHLMLLEAVTNQVGVALENARLYQDLQRHKENLEALVQERTQQLQQAEAQLVKRERLATLGQLAGSLGHELRGPLVNLRMVLSLLNEADPEMRADLIARMDRELSRCNSVINDLLDYTKGREPERSQTSLAAILHQAARVLPREPRLEVALELDEVERIPLDPDQVLRLFENLLNNASEAVTGQGRVRIRLLDAGSELEVRVEDSGPGVPEEMRERIFEPLITTRRGGTGLGLAVCRRTVDAHGGRIWVESSPDLEGASFVVRLPKT